MINALCVIQEQQGPDQNRDNLAVALNAYSEEFLDDSLSVNWLTVPKGNGFTAGKPSTASVVSLTAKEPLTQDRREVLLRELVTMWTKETGCFVDEVVAVIADPAQA